MAWTQRASNGASNGSGRNLRTKIPAIVASAQRTAEKWKPGAIERMIGGMQKRITSVELINERFVMIEVPGQATCVAQRSDALFMSKDDFKARYGNLRDCDGRKQQGRCPSERRGKDLDGRSPPPQRE